MKNSLQIAQEAELEPIVGLAERIGLDHDEIEPYGGLFGGCPQPSSRWIRVTSRA